MKNEKNQYLTKIKNNLRVDGGFLLTILCWLAFAVTCGFACGIVGVGFDYFLEFVSESFSKYPILVVFLPLCGLAIVLLYKLCRVQKDGGFEIVLKSIRDNTKVSYICAPLVFLCTGLTHCFGGSSGREGAALQIGGTVGTMIGRGLRFKEKETNILALCGMSAVFSAVFGTPITATLLAIEIVSTDGMYYMALLPCLISSVIAFWLAGVCGVVPTAERFAAVNVPEFSIPTLIRVLIAALVFSLVAVIFVNFTKVTKKGFQKLLKNPYLRIAVGGVIIALLSGALYLATGSFDYNGAGMSLVVAAVSGSARPEAFALKIIFTAVTLGCGFKGGKIVPAFCIGATFGCVIAPVLGLDPGFCAALGMITLFSGMDNCPIAAIMLSIELFGSCFGATGFIYFALVCTVMYMLTGYFKLYSGRENIYSSLLLDYARHDSDSRDKIDK